MLVDSHTLEARGGKGGNGGQDGGIINVRYSGGANSDAPFMFDLHPASATPADNALYYPWSGVGTPAYTGVAGTNATNASTSANGTDGVDGGNAGGGVGANSGCGTGIPGGIGQPGKAIIFW